MIINKFTKLVLIVYLVLGITLSFPISTLAVNNTQSAQSNPQRTKDWNALINYSRKYPKQLPEWKAKAILLMLDKVGFFRMTRIQKYAYLHANIQNSVFLALVAQAEGIFADVSYQNDGQQVNFIISRKDAALVWYKFIKDLYSTNGQFDARKYLQKGITNKSYWSGENLDLLYNSLWTDLKANRNLGEFTCQEKKRLSFLNARDPGVIEKFFRGVMDFIIPVTISQDNKVSPQVLDVLSFIPIPVIGKLASRGLKFVKTPVRAAVEKIAPRAVAQTGKLASSRGAVLLSKAVERIGAKKVARATVPLMRTLNGYKFDLNKVFGQAGIRAGKDHQNWMGIMNIYTKAISQLTRSSWTKPYIGKLAFRYDQYLIETMRIKKLSTNIGGRCLWGQGNICEFNETYLSGVLKSSYQQSYSTAIHEFIHAIVGLLTQRNIYRSPMGRKINVAYSYINANGKTVRFTIKDEYGYGFARLEESFTDFIAGHMGNCANGLGRCGYPEKQVSIAGAVMSALSRKSYLTGKFTQAQARGIASTQLSKGMFTYRAIEDLDTALGQKGAIRHVADLLEQQRDREAAEFLDSLHKVEDKETYDALYWGVRQYYY